MVKNLPGADKYHKPDWMNNLNYKFKTVKSRLAIFVDLFFIFGWLQIFVWIILQNNPINYYGEMIKSIDQDTIILIFVAAFFGHVFLNMRGNEIFLVDGKMIRVKHKPSKGSAYFEDFSLSNLKGYYLVDVAKFLKKEVSLIIQYKNGDFAIIASIDLPTNDTKTIFDLKIALNHYGLKEIAATDIQLIEFVEKRYLPKITKTL